MVLHGADDDVIAGADVGVPQLLATRLIPSVVPGRTPALPLSGHSGTARPADAPVPSAPSPLRSAYGYRDGRRHSRGDKTPPRRELPPLVLRAGGAVEIDQRLTVDLPAQQRKIRAYPFYRKCHAFSPGRRWPIRARICALSVSSPIASVSSAAKAYRIICCAARWGMPRERR